MCEECYNKFLISIHPPRGGRDVAAHRAALASKISIHPPRGGRDSKSAQFVLLKIVRFARTG